MDITEQEIKTHRDAMMAQLRRYGIKDARVLKAMEQIRRHLFILEGETRLQLAYGDHPCSIGYGQTISQPYIVAYMTELLQVKPHDKILEIGTGCGYQTAILASLGASVYTIETIAELARQAISRLKQWGYENIHYLVRNGMAGWPEEAPFEKILVSCAPKTIPDALIGQLMEGGRMVIPVGESDQRLYLITKDDGIITKAKDLPVRFVPMIDTDIDN